MIYVGYQGIGKSTLCNKFGNCLDLESGNFWVDGKRIDDWYKVYANIAEHLSNQGKNVFTASHKVFRDYLKEKNIEFIAVFPTLALKDQWIKKLEDRYNLTQSTKDYKALMNAKEMYEENIKDLMGEEKTIEIMNIDYSLERLINIERHLYNVSNKE